ncbi:MAG: DHH family phosphoesterase [Deltaproteobacteria bacterium]|jgi:nanoRNase/pAp phosphatase (c-di-AMP/oligoRNAs hydrolase)|nr:DHH family phosphoesterase [Deltaproteobacteria bacterium]
MTTNKNRDKRDEPATPPKIPKRGTPHHHHARLSSLYGHFARDDRVLIVITADPDSIASAVALKRLLWHRVHQVSIASTNEVRRPDNLRLLKGLALKLPLLSDVKIADFTKFAMVDSQPHHSPQMNGIDFAVIIDHHPPGPKAANDKNVFHDIRPDWGATASILVNYLQAARVKPNKALATALFYAIKTDTQNFVRQGQLEDMRAFRWVFPFIHPPLLSDIEMSPIDRSAFEVFKVALNETIFYKQYAFAYMDDLDHPDTLVIVADFLMQVVGVTRVIVSGVFDNRLIVVLRSAGLRGNLGKLAAQAFGSLGSAGGHRNMARAEIELDALDPRIAHKPAKLANFIIDRLSDALSAKKEPAVPRVTRPVRATPAARAAKAAFAARDAREAPGREKEEHPGKGARAERRTPESGTPGPEIPEPEIPGPAKPGPATREPGKGAPRRGLSNLLKNPRKK